MNARGELSQFTEHRTELGIEHIVASKRRPTTIGKIEAFHKAYVNEAHLFNKHWTFIRYYNHKRPHEALNYLTPARALVNFRRLETKKAWKQIQEWNKWNRPSLPDSELLTCFQSAVRNRYVYGCSDSILTSLCEKENCTVAKKKADSSPDRVFDPEVEAEINSELDKILAARADHPACCKWKIS